MTTPTNPPDKLKKALGLFDVYAICTGAMFSSGFFLLPGLAAAQTGPSVALAYLIAGVLMLPAMFSMAELATAMPRAGGDYYFLDRALGPMIGTIGGVGTYLALTLKSAFALIGMGAYLAIFIEVPIQPLAVALTVAFMLINIFGAKETTNIQRILIVILISVLAFFIAGGLFTIATGEPGDVIDTQFTPFFTDGVAGLLGTVGFVFVSYAGLTKIASVAEEVVNPGRNIPLGMMLSILTTTFIYVVGIVVMISVLDADEFRSDLTPVATAAEAIFELPGALGVGLIVLSAVAAFASTGNAGILAASRYPLAMGRDRLIPGTFASVNPRLKTPVFSILVTGGLMIGAILLLREEDIAKIASTFQLLIFMLVNFSVIVMRESRIMFYDPIYRTPLYPYMQIFGVLASILLITYLGTDAILMTVGVIGLALLWYASYGRARVVRHGAIYHWFAQLGQRAYVGLENELREIMKEKGLRDEDPFDDVITRAAVLEARPGQAFDDIATEVAHALTQKYPLVQETVIADLISKMHDDDVLRERGAALPNVRLQDVDHAELFMIRSKEGMHIPMRGSEAAAAEAVKMHAIFFLISPEKNPTQHLRILAQLTQHIDYAEFRYDWLHAVSEQELKEIMLHDDRMLTLWVAEQTSTQVMIGKMLRELRMPEGSLVALVRRGDNVIIPSGKTVLQPGDRITIIGEPEQIQTLYEQYVGNHSDTGALADSPKRRTQEVLPLPDSEAP
ncbi:MAG: amino acid permease [Anaerolineales bacterium]